MLKMILDPMGGIILTNDGNAILREIDLSRMQDEECGDGTTSVIILAQSLSQLERNIHPVVIISAHNKALQTALEWSRWADLMCCLALDAVRTVAADDAGGVRTVDIKRYARVEKVPSGEIEESRVLSGDIVHPQMRRRIHKPRLVLFDCPLELEFARINQIEEEQAKVFVDRILEFNPDLVITEKGISDYAQYFFKANVSALRRVRKSDNNRIARAVGATIVNRVEDLREADVGTRCGLFNIEKIGDEYFTFLTECTTPKACTILLRGPSKDILNEIDRNLADAMSVARNVVFNPTLVPGGGAVEMAISVGLHGRARTVTGVEAGPFRAVADALEVIPRTLVQNAGGNALTALRAKHANGEEFLGYRRRDRRYEEVQVVRICQRQGSFVPPIPAICRVSFCA
ncbi:TCP-1/cpn60 chaperonin family-domain-containing protein [Russula dissimulans]|nr:TCP-1/cpn60 chaperonin family-domain-containing protein [Russula dissimulans]